ncbi:MAG: hypothetical protein AAGK37_10675 [Pseudomonadota bacterium]
MIRGFGVLVLGLIGVPGVVAAEPWDVIAERCLAPMERFIPGQIEGITQIGGVAPADDTLSFDIGRAGAAPRVSTGSISEVSVEVAEEIALGPAQSWRVEAQATDRYVETADGVLEAHIWRKPRLSVRIEHDEETGRAVFTAEETDLES